MWPKIEVCNVSEPGAYTDRRFLCGVCRMKRVLWHESSFTRSGPIDGVLDDVCLDCFARWMGRMVGGRPIVA